MKPRGKPCSKASFHPTDHQEKASAARYLVYPRRTRTECDVADVHVDADVGAHGPGRTGSSAYISTSTSTRQRVIDPSKPVDSR